MSPIAKKAIEFCEAGHSPSDAAVLATMGHNISPAAIARVEQLCVVDRMLRDRRRATKGDGR